MAGRWAAIALVVSVLAAPALAAQARKKAPEPPPPPPQFRVDVATRSMALARVALSFPETTVVGDMGLEFFCGGKSPIDARSALGTVPKEDYVKVFAAEAAAAGYKMPASQTDLFATADTSAPELQVGAAIVSLSEHGCPSGNAFTGVYVNMEAVIGIEWQVFDPLEKKLLFRATSEGTAKARATLGAEEIKYPSITARRYGVAAADAARDAFQQAAKAILADPNFIAAVRDPRGGAPVSPGALFPEAQNAAPGAAPSVQIIRVGPNTKPFKDLVTQLRDQVVTVDSGNGTGSGFYIADGLLLTNHHVVAGTQHVKIRFLGGRQIDGQVVTSHAKRDVALIKTEGAGVAGLPLRLENPELASQVFVIGSPRGPRQEGSIAAGIISAFRDDKEGPYIQSDVATTFGNSGGPMFDDKGNVIALVVSGYGGTAINFFIPIADALKVLGIHFAP